MIEYYNVDMKIFETLSKRVSKNADSFNATDLTHTIWAFAYISSRSKYKFKVNSKEDIIYQNCKLAILKALKPVLIKNIHLLGREDIQKIQSALRYWQDPTLTKTFEKRLNEIVSSPTSPQGIATEVKNLFEARDLELPVAQRYLEQIQTDINNFIPSDLVRMTEPVLVNYYHCKEPSIKPILLKILSLLFRKIDDTDPAHNWAPEDISQIYITHALFSCEDKAFLPLSPNLTAKLSAFRESRPGEGQESPSPLQSKIFKILKNIKPMAEQERFFEGLLIDFVIEEDKLALELDGKEHNELGTETARRKDIIKEKMFAHYRKDWVLLRIPSSEVKKKSEQEIIRYLQDRIRERK